MSEELKGVKLIKALVQALRSGNYTQAFGHLRIGEKCFCPLGLFAHIIDPNGWTIEKGYPYTLYYWHNNSAMIGSSIVEKRQVPTGLIGYLLEWNDVDKFTFSQIADMIEHYYT